MRRGENVSLGKKSRVRRSLCLGALQLVSGFNRRAREAERAQVYTYDVVEIRKVSELGIDCDARRYSSTGVFVTLQPRET